MAGDIIESERISARYLQKLKLFTISDGMRNENKKKRKRRTAKKKNHVP